MNLIMIKEMLFYLFIVAFVPLALSNPVKLDAGTNVHVRLIREASETRSRRSAHEVQNGHLPEELTFGVGLPGSDVTLRMKRSKLLPTVTNNGAVDVTIQHAAVYTDHSKHSAMIVKREADKFKLKGSFVHKDVEWELEPLARKVRSSETHQVKQRKGRDSVILFGDDEYYIKKTTRPGKNPETAQSQQQDNNNNYRHKRSVVDHVVEIAFIADFADYSKWIDLVGSTNALTEMQLWYTYVADMINIRYQTIDDADISISTRVTILKILTEQSQSAFIDDLVDVNTNTFSGKDGLFALRTWYREANDLPTSDHYMLFTGQDISGAVGIAFTGELCSPFSVSINENTFQGSLGSVAAHELGHSLSAEHDSNTTCNNDQEQYVMSTILSTPISPDNEGNSWKFSQCSIQAFKNYLQSVSCTLPEATTIPDELPAPVEGQRGGEVLSLDTQCQRNFQSDSSRFCEQVQAQNGGIESLCGGMYCLIPDGDGFCQTALPLEYSSCGTQKWCVLGSCVDKVTITTPSPTTTTTTTPTTTTTTPTTITTTPTTTTTTTTPTTTTTTPTTTTTTPTTPTTTTTTTTPTTTTTTPPPPTTTTTTRTTPTTTTTRATTPTTTTTTKTPTTTTTATTQSPQKSPTTTPAPTTPSTTTTAPTTTTTTTSTTTRRTRPTPRPKPDQGPKDFDDCHAFLRGSNWNDWWKCIQKVWRYQRSQRQRRRKSWWF